MRRRTTLSSPSRDHRNQYDIFNNLYYSKVECGFALSYFDRNASIFYLYIYLFFLFTRHYKRGRETYRYYGFSVDELDLSYNFHIRGEKYLSKIFEYFNALRPLIFELLQVQYLFRIDFWIFFIVKNENLVIFVYMYKMTKENCISDEMNCPILTV